MASTLGTTEATPLAPVAPAEPRQGRGRKGPYPYWFYIPAAIIYVIFFIAPTILSFYFSFTRWDLFHINVDRAEELRDRSSMSRRWSSACATP